MFVQEIYSRLLQDPEEVPVGTLFSTFLLLTAKPEINNLPSSAPLNTLFIAAVRGSESARGVVSRVLEYYDTLPQDEVRNHFADWLRRSAATGSLIAKEELNRVDPTILLSCLEYFRQMGGYARHYDPIDPQKEGPLEDYIPSPGDYPLHWLATYGSFEVLIYMLDSQGPYEINAMNDAGATPLYNACARGSWKIAQALLDHGADASIQCTSIGITCLHWLFAFDEHDQEHACSRLVSAGADVDAMTALITPFLHYPFVLPLGSSLHWAVVLGAQTTVKVLIQAGANVLLRNDGDHYVYDGRVRVLDKWAANQEAYSVPLHKVEGLCPLDYAAMNHDPFIFEFLVCSGRHVNINAVDEEGFSVLHRLSTAPSRETRTGVEFSHLVFQGRPAVVEQRIARTIAAIKILGGDLELITKSPRAVTEAGTPLMMAALGQCPVVVKALLEAGANVETRNESGLSALMCLSLEDKEAASENMRTLVSFGADIHHSTKDGLTPVILAARAKLEDVVDLLLSRGVDIDTRAPETADNLFACLADEDDEEHDHAIAALLDKYVFNCLDAAKRQRVIEYVNIDGETLLHKYAACGMQHCIEALIANGAPVNASKYEYMRETQEETLFKVFWQETPLDVALVEKERRLRDLKRDSQYTLKKIEERCRKIDVVIEILEKAGGLQKAGEKQKQPLMFDFEDYGGSRYKNYLRDA
jgi:ankyrin repeat protein